MAGIDLSGLFPQPGPVTLVDAHVRIMFDPASGKVHLHTDEKIGPAALPSFDMELDPLHAIHLGAVGVQGVLAGVFGPKKS